MWRKFIWKTLPDPKRLASRFRHIKPLCPIPSDYSKVDKVTICGANNPLGQALAFLLKKSEIIREIALYDEGNVRGLALDLEHIPTKTKVRPNSGDYAMKNALRNSDIIVITNGFEASLDADENVSIRENAAMIYKYGVKIASACPEALVCIITPPINVMVPLFSETPSGTYDLITKHILRVSINHKDYFKVMKVCGVYDPNKIFGVCSLMETRANSIVADYLSLDPAAVKVPVIGGVTPKSVVPLLSHAKPYNEFTDAEIRMLVNAILEVPGECKKLQTTAPLSTAYALSRFVLTLSAGLCTCDCAVQTAFVRSDVLSQVKFFASGVRTGIMGAIENYGLPKIHEFELSLLSQASVVLEEDFQKACILFSEIHSHNRRDEIEEICRPNKPFIRKTPCPPCPSCLPTDVCQEKLPEDPCAPTKELPCYCRISPKC